MITWSRRCVIIRWRPNRQRRPSRSWKTIISITPIWWTGRAIIRRRPHGWCSCWWWSLWWQPCRTEPIWRMDWTAWLPEHRRSLGWLSVFWPICHPTLSSPRSWISCLYPVRRSWWFMPLPLSVPRSVSYGTTHIRPKYLWEIRGAWPWEVLSLFSRSSSVRSCWFRSFAVFSWWRIYRSCCKWPTLNIRRRSMGKVAVSSRWLLYTIISRSRETRVYRRWSKSRSMSCLNRRSWSVSGWSVLFWLLWR